MKILLTLLLFSALIPAHGAPEQDAVAATTSTAKPEASAAIDDTPVAALAVGGSIRLLNTHQDLSDPEQPTWREAQEYRLELGMAPPVHQSVNLRYDPSTPAVPVFIRTASDGQRLYLRMRWTDTSANDTTSRRDFADGAAVQFALGAPAADGSNSTSFMMGAPTGPVNIWYWRAGEAQAQNLAAGGFGSTTRLAPAGLTAHSVHRDGEWIVVFSRPLAAAGEHQVQLASGQASLSFALWQGDQRQRDGLKHVSMGWVSLQSEPGKPES